MEKLVKLIIPWNNSSGVKKMLLYMRLTFLILLTVVLQTIAGETYSQTTNLSLNLKNAPVQTVLQQIEDQSEFYFLYSRSVINVDRSVAVQFKNAKIDEILSSLFEGTDVAYKVDGRQIVLSKKIETTENKEQQTKSISGKVSDSGNLPLPGVSVSIKGTTRGIITDNNGNYTLTNIPANAILQFSFVGMRTQEIKFVNQSTINVILEEETKGIEEVMVVAYGTAKKSTYTGSSTVLKAEKIEKISGSGFAETLQGMSAGVNVVNN